VRESRTALRAALVALGAIAVACGGESPSEPVTDPAILARVHDIVVTISNSTTSILAPGSIITLTAQARDSVGVALPVSSYVWTSWDTTVAVVDAQGRVTARNGGYASIHVVAGGKQGDLQLKIIAPGNYRVLSDTSQMLVGQQRTLVAVTTRPTFPIGFGFFDPGSFPVPGAWTSSNPAVAKVDSNGIVTAVGPGRATLSFPPSGVIQSGLTVSVVVPDAPLPLRFLQLVSTTYSSGYGDEFPGFVCGRTAADTWCWGDASGGQLGTSAQIDQCRQLRSYGRYYEYLYSRCALEPVRVAAPAPFVAISTGGTRTPCGITAEGRAYCWGDTRVFTGLATGSATPTLVSSTLRFTSFEFPCGVTTTHEAYCYVLPTVPDSVPAVLPIQVGSGMSWRSVAGGNTAHRCGITTSDVLMCWGANDRGQLGNGTTTDSPAPVTVAIPEPVGSVILLGKSACALATAGSVWCWGGGTSTPKSVVPGMQFAFLGAGPLSTCAVTAGGGAYCGDSHSPSAPWGPSGFLDDGGPRAFTGSIQQYCEIRNDGLAYCWGENRYGQQGIGSQGYPKTRMPVVGQ
jgi:Regulator of chromosome condensation (RCC1) repeat